MELKVLCVGDVVGEPGMQHVCRHLRAMRRELQADFVIVNGENASVVGITPNQAEDIFDAGADVITLGNHAFSKREIVNYLDDHQRILRPVNMAPQLPGAGYGVYESTKGWVGVVNLIGRCNMDYNPDNPFLMMDKLLPKLDCNVILVEIHAEATSEKLAMGYMLDGKVSAVWGTHTHVPTADVRILPKGTGYVTDLGMTGPQESVLGIRPELSIAKFRGDLTERYRWAEGVTKMEAVLFSIDTASGRCLNVKRVDQWT